MKRLCCIMLLLATVYTSKACDVCGASSSSQGFGLLPQMTRHFAGLQYQSRSFNSTQEALSETAPATYSKELYQTIQAWGRYSVREDLQLFAFVPYQINQRTSANTTTENRGIGDISVLASYVAVNSADSSSIKHRLQIGGGVKAPTGKHVGVTELEKQGLPNMQPGTGSWDFLLNTNYTARVENVGINIDANYTITTLTSDRYKYGNRLATQLSAFYSYTTGSIVLMPNVGLRYDYTLHDYENYDKKWLNTGTGGYISYLTAGVQAYYQNVGIQLSYSKPIVQDFANGNVNAQSNITAGALIVF